jgi:hypothetical protein
MTWTTRHRQGISIALIALATAAVYWPALRSRFVLDDFFLYVMALHTGNPLALFVHSHFPGSFFYRPLGMTLWWLSAELFGNAPRPHYFLDLCLHIAVAWAFWRLAVRWTQARTLALVLALVFAVHPIAIGTSLWLADRFDLLAALLGMLAIAAAWDYARDGRRAALLATFAFAALAAFAKEIGYSVFVPVVLIWAWPLAAPATSLWTRERRAACFIALLAVLMLLWRRWLIGDVGTQAVLGNTPLWQEVLEGSRKWGINLVAYVLDLGRLGIAALVVEAAAGLALVALLVVGVARGRVLRHERIALFASAGFVLATIVLQAPVLRTLPSTWEAPSAAHAMATGARLFYLSLLGLLLFIGALAGVAARAFAANRRVGQGAIVAALCCIVPWAIDAHGLARGYKQESLPQATLAEAALAAVANTQAIGERCQVHFLGMDKALSPSQELAFSMQIDAAIKTLAPSSRADLQTCRFQTDRTPWFYVVKRGALTLANVAPMEPVYIDGKLVPWLEFGDAEIAYLNLQAYVDPKTLTAAHFFDYAGGAFTDVTAEVLAGRREVKFRCGRRASQCVLPDTAK